MRITVNGNNITGERLVNKNLNFTYGDGFRTTYYSKDMTAWYLFFSPDFVGYDNPRSPTTSSRAMPMYTNSMSPTS